MLRSRITPLFTLSSPTLMVKDRHPGHLKIETNRTDAQIWSSRLGEKRSKDRNEGRHEGKTLEDLSPFCSLES